MNNSELRANLSESEILFLTIVGEARGEPIEGQVAVGNVILNRSTARKQSILDICLAPKQFSCWNENDPNRAVLIELANKILFGSNSYDDYKQIQWIVEGLMDKKVSDNTHGSNYYMVTGLLNSDKRPVWASRIHNSTVVGHHTFFNI